VVPIDAVKRGTLRKVLLAWWEIWRRTRNALTELACCGSEVDHIASDIGVTPGELRVLAAKRPDAAGLLYQRLASLNLDAKKIAITEGAVLRDLQRLCTICERKGRCARDLANHSSTPDWQVYCPNASTLAAVMTEAEDEKALSRLERWQARARGVP
jgi:uncharacterized protein YjiS (DUF1127 family)